MIVNRNPIRRNSRLVGLILTNAARNFGSVGFKFHGPDDPTPESSSTAVVDPPAPVTDPNPNPNPAIPPKTFTQEQLNQMLASDRRKAKQQNQELIEKLRTLEQSSGLTQQERDELKTNIEQLQNRYETETEQKNRELDREKKKHSTEVAELTKERDTWKTRFDQKSIAVDISAAAVEFKACSPEQIRAIIGPQTKMVEKVDESGKPTGELESKVDFVGEKDGKEVQIQLSVRDAVKRMTEMPEKYGNLFHAEGIAGLQRTNNQNPMSNSAIPDIASMSPAQFKEHRAKIHAEMAKRG